MRHALLGQAIAQAEQICGRRAVLTPFFRDMPARIDHPDADGHEGLMDIDAGTPCVNHVHSNVPFRRVRGQS
jgi:hypothetical protein